MWTTFDKDSWSFSAEDMIDLNKIPELDLTKIWHQITASSPWAESHRQSLASVLELTAWTTHEMGIWLFVLTVMFWTF